MNIEQLLTMPTGKENRTGGFELTVRTARSPRELNGKKLQSVILEDETGKIDADILLQSSTTKSWGQVQRRWTIKVIIGWLQPSPNNEHKTLYVEQWSTETQTADEYYDQKQQERQQGLYHVYEKDYETPDIPGMCATHIIEGFINGYTAKHGEIPDCTPERMKIVNEWVAFNVNGRLAEAKGGDDNG